MIDYIILPSADDACLVDDPRWAEDPMNLVEPWLKTVLSRDAIEATAKKLAEVTKEAA